MLTPPCRDCVSRREFLARGTVALAGVAAAVAGCGDGEFGPTAARPVDGTVSLKVSSLPQLATVGQPVFVPGTDNRITVQRTGPSSFLALSAICTHQGTLVTIQSDGFVCPNHLAAFDRTGNVTRQPQSAGSATPLPRFPTRYDAATDTLTIG